MVKSGKYEVKQPNIFGRIGSGIGKGLAEQFPKEMERGRLSHGLQNFEKESGNLTPLQQYTRLAAIPGITPQMIQALPEVLKQQNFSNSLLQGANNRNEQVSNPYKSVNAQPQQNESGGVTTRKGIEETLQPYISPTYDEQVFQAEKDFPQLFKTNPKEAIQAIQDRENLKEKRNLQYQTQRQNEQKIQKDIGDVLDTQRRDANVKIPENVYSDIKDKAINSVLAKELGGEGLTDQQANKKYRDNLNEVSRQYESMNTLASGDLPMRSPSEIRRNLKSLREDFKKRDDLRNFADTLVGVNKLSYPLAYHEAFPPSEIPELSKTLNKIPDVNPVVSFNKGYFEKNKTDYKPDAILKQITPKLAKDMGKEGSPLAISEELSSKGYDPSYFMDYLNNNREKLDLTGRQSDELTKPRNFLPTLDDLWLFKLSGQDKLVD